MCEGRVQRCILPFLQAEIKRLEGGLVMEQKKEEVIFFCKGCRNQCRLEVILLDGKVTEVTGGGCRRSLKNAKKYLEK